ENQPRGIGQRGPGERYELTLPRRQPGAALAHLGLEALRERGESVEQPEDAQRLLDLGVGCLRAPDPNVVAQRAREQESLLGNDDDAPPQRDELGVPQ